MRNAGTDELIGVLERMNELFENEAGLIDEETRHKIAVLRDIIQQRDSEVSEGVLVCLFCVC